MSICIQRDVLGPYRIHHRPIQGRDRYRWIDGPIFRRPVKGKAHADLVYLQFGMGDGPWIVMVRDYLTGKAYRLRGTGDWMIRAEAETALRTLAAAGGWREVTDTGTPDFVCKGSDIPG